MGLLFRHLAIPYNLIYARIREVKTVKTRKDWETGQYNPLIQPGQRENVCFFRKPAVFPPLCSGPFYSRASTIKNTHHCRHCCDLTYESCQTSRKYDRIVDHIPEDMDLGGLNLTEVLRLAGL